MFDFQQIHYKLSQITIEYVIFLMKNPVIVILLLLSISVASQECGQQQSTDLLITTTKSLSRDLLSDKSRTTYNLPISIASLNNRKYQYALSTQSIQNYNIQDGIDYDIQGFGVVGVQQFFITARIQNNHNWTQVTISVMISASDDFILGNKFLQESNIQQSGNKSINIDLPQNEIKPNNNYGARVFISGLVSNDSFSLVILKQEIDITTGKLNVNFSSAFITKILLYYVVYNTDNNLFTFSDKIASQTYQFEGPIRMVSDKVQPSRISICRRRQCRQNQVAVGKQCKCREGFIRVQEDCIQKCPDQDNAFIDITGKCQCLQGFYRINGQPCGQCDSGYYYDQTNSFCYLCPSNCIKCKNYAICETCNPAFNKRQDEFFGEKFISCESQCGDGLKSLNEECDDQNTGNGDGCSSECYVEEGWSCYGGSPTRKSLCNLKSQERIYMEIGRIVSRGNRTAVEINVNQRPKCLDTNYPNCQDCKSLFVVQYESQIKLNPVVQQFSDKNRFVISFYYVDGLFLSNPFIFDIKLNPELQCLVEEDLRQRIKRKYDPALS